MSSNLGEDRQTFQRETDRPAATPFDAVRRRPDDMAVANASPKAWPADVMSETQTPQESVYGASHQVEVEALIPDRTAESRASPSAPARRRTLVSVRSLPEPLPLP